MSFLDDLFGGDNHPTHAIHNAKVAAHDAQQQQARQAAMLAQEQQQKQAQALQGAYGYFQNAGVNPAQYDAAIKAAISSGSTGQSVFNELQNAYRQKKVGAFSQFAPTGFANNLISGSADDDVISKLIGEGRTGANQYVDNLFSRGLITNAGKAGAYGDLDAQSARINGMLQDLGTSILGGGRSTLEGIADQGRLAAGGLTLGASFDPNSYKTQIDSALDDFLGGLEGKFRAQAPSELFQTAGLQNKAGAAMGAQNLPFSGAALAGQPEDDQDEENRKQGIF